MVFLVRIPLARAAPGDHRGIQRDRSEDDNSHREWKLKAKRRGVTQLLQSITPATPVVLRVARAP